MFHKYSIFPRRKADNSKVVLFSLLSAGAAGVVGYFSHKSKREKAIKKVNNLGENLKDFGNKSYKEAEKFGHNIAKQTVQLKDRVTSNTPPPVDLKEVVENSLKNNKNSKNDFDPK